MTPLRGAMITAMQQRGFSPRTCESYLYAVQQLAAYYHRCPDRISAGQLRGYITYLATERKLAPASCRLYFNGLMFLYREVLQRNTDDLGVVLPKRAQRIPELLTRAEVAALLGACAHPMHRSMLCCAYGCGLRLGELVRLRVRAIDSERMVVHIEQGKGAKDRLVRLSPALLSELRAHWLRYRPADWLFPGRAAGIDKHGGIHALRHAYATHQLAAGMPVTELQHQLGHRHVSTTLRYLHWLPDYREQGGGADLLAEIGA
jgi:integrase/recombinase XerD